MFERHYISISESRIYETENSRYINEEKYKPYLDWLGAGNVPPAVSADRFVEIVDGAAREVADKAAILEAEEYARTHPPPASNETVSALCRVVDALIRGDLDGAPFFDYIRSRWYARAITAADVAEMVKKRRITQAEADQILAVERMPEGAAGRLSPGGGYFG